MLWTGLTRRDASRSGGSVRSVNRGRVRLAGNSGDRLYVGGVKVYMPAPQPKSTDQLRAIFGLGKNLGMDKPDLEAVAAEVTAGRIERLSLLTFDEANAVIVRLGGESFPSPGHVAVRTANYRRQKAGVKQVETSRHLKLISDLAAKRNMSRAGLASLCMRIIKRASPATTAQGNMVVEALKAMNRRDGTRTPTAARIGTKETA